LNLTIDSRAAADAISADINLEQRKRPTTLLLRLRHPQGKPMQSVSVNGKKWTDFDVTKEWVRILSPEENRYLVTAKY
jgi:hypothetical protein